MRTFSKKIESSYDVSSPSNDETFSLLSLLRNNTLISIQVHIVTDNAKRPSEDLLGFVAFTEEYRSRIQDNDEEEEDNDENDDDDEISLAEEDLRGGDASFATRSACQRQRSFRAAATTTTRASTTTSFLVQQKEEQEEEDKLLMSCPNLNYHQKLLSPGSQCKAQARWCYDESPKTPRRRASQYKLQRPQRMPSIQKLL